MAVNRFGQWDKAKRALGSNLGERLARALRQATAKNAMLLVREIKKGIVSQAPGGQPFAKLAKGTVRRKKSSKALIDTGFLLASVTQLMLADRAFVGLLRGARNEAGDEIANIGAVMEYGATIQHPNGAVIVIPARPFLHPAMEKCRGQVLENYREAVRSVLG